MKKQILFLFAILSSSLTYAKTTLCTCYGANYSGCSASNNEPDAVRLRIVVNQSPEDVDKKTGQGTIYRFKKVVSQTDVKFQGHDVVSSDWRITNLGPKSQRSSIYVFAGAEELQKAMNGAGSAKGYLRCTTIDD